MERLLHLESSLNFLKIKIHPTFRKNNFCFLISAFIKKSKGYFLIRGGRCVQRGEAGNAERGEVTVREVEELFVQGAYVEVFFLNSNFNT